MSNNANSQGNVKVPGRLKQTAIDAHGNLLPIAGASDIYDDVSEKSQAEINAEQALVNEELRNATGMAPSREEEIEDPYALMFNGMQKVYLKKNVVESNGEAHNLLTQDMFYRYDEELEERVPATNSIFIIQYEYELAEDITIPENSVLQFDGGSISGDGTGKDTITGNNTRINDSENIFENIVIAGTWNATVIRASMFIQSSNILEQIQNLMNSNIHNDVYIDKDCIAILPNIYNGTAFDVCGNSTIYITKTISTNDLVNSVSIINVNADNVNIIGGTIVGPKDSATAEQATWEWQHGITVGGNNVNIEGVNISKLMGDGIYINSSNVTIKNCDISYVNRNGISVTDNSPYDILLSDNYIHNITGGVLNMGIDFEPNSGIVNCSTIQRNKVVNCEGIQILKGDDIIIENNETSSIIIGSSSKNIKITSNNTNNLTIGGSSKSINVENNQISRNIDIINSSIVVLKGNSITFGNNNDISGKITFYDNDIDCNGKDFYINKGDVDCDILFENNRFLNFNLYTRNSNLTTNDVIRFKNNEIACGGTTIVVGGNPYLVFENNKFNVSNLNDYLITPSSGGLNLYKDNVFVLDSSITVGRFIGISNTVVVFIGNILVTSIRAITCYSKFSDVTYVNSITDIPMPLKTFGDSAGRPANNTVPKGFCYFDLTLGKPIWNNDNWIDATGTPV